MKAEKNTVKIPQEIADDIQSKDVAYQTGKDVLMQILESHQADPDTSFLESPVFAAFQKDVAGKKLAWEKAKKEMSDKYLPADLTDKIKEWSLDYYSCELTYRI